MLANRKAPPDAILQEVYRRTGDKPFKNIDDVISREELVALSESYKRVAGYDKERLKARADATRKKITTTKIERCAYIRRHPLISWPLDDGAFRLDITVRDAYR